MLWELERFQDNNALIDEFGRVLTYRQLDDEGKRLSEVVESRTLVFILCRNEIGSILGYVSFLNAGIVPALLNAHIETGLLHNLLSAYEPQYLWVPQEQTALFPDMEVVYSAYDYCLIRTKFQTEHRLYPDLALLLTTSGSTGSIKYVRQSYGNILSNAESIVEYLHLDASERPITSLPMNYTFGLSIINSHLLVGATVLVTDKSIMQKEFWTFFKEQQATSISGVPYTFEMLERLRFFRMQLPSLRTMTQAGGKLSVNLHEKYAKYALETGRNFVVMYGQCEATARMAYLPPEKALEYCGSMGVAIPGGKFHLIDEDGSEIVQPHVTGELVYEGPNVTLGYAQCAADLSKGDERHGILETGDMAQVDEDGYYYIVGRKKRFLKLFGNRVNLDEIDQMVKCQFGNIDFACGGIDDHMYLFGTDRSTVDEIKSYVVAKTGLNPAAFSTVVIDAIPKNEAGKTLYRELERYYGV